MLTLIAHKVAPHNPVPSCSCSVVPSDNLSLHTRSSWELALLRYNRLVALLNGAVIYYQNDSVYISVNKMAVVS